MHAAQTQTTTNSVFSNKNHLHSLNPPSPIMTTVSSAKLSHQRVLPKQKPHKQIVKQSSINYILATQAKHQTHQVTKAQTNTAKRVRKVLEVEPKSPRVKNGRTTAPPPQVEIGSAKTQVETEIGANSQPRLR